MNNIVLTKKEIDARYREKHREEIREKSKLWERENRKKDLLLAREKDRKHLWVAVVVYKER